MLLSALEAIRAASAESLAPLAFFPPPPPPTSSACLRLLLRTSCSVGVDFLILLPQLKLGSTTSAVENINFATSSPQHLPFMAFTIVFTLKEGPLRCGAITDPRNKNKNQKSGKKDYSKAWEEGAP